MRKILKKNNLEILALLSTATGFVVSFEVGVLFGISKETDAYLTSIILINFLSLLSQITWETINIKYIGKSRNDKNTLFSTHLYSTTVVALLLCFFYMAFDSVFLRLLELDNTVASKYIIVTFLFLFCIFTYLKRVVFCEEDLFLFYLVEFFYQGLIFLLIIVCFILDVDIVISNVISLFVCNIILISFVYFKYGIRLHSISVTCLLDGLNGSIKLKAGAFCYSIKDILIPALFIRYGDGAYTVYNYLSKILTALLSIVVLPKVNYFAIESLKAKGDDISSIFKKASLLSLKYSIVYSAISIASIVPFILIMNKITDSGFYFLIFISLCVFIFNLIICAEQFFARVVYNFECFNFIFLINVIFGSIIYYIVKLSGSSISVGLIMVVALQLLNFTFYFIKAKVVSEKNQFCN